MFKNRESTTFLLGAVVAVSLAVLSGCETPTIKSGTPTASGAPHSKITIKAEPGLSPRQRFRKALDYLENGEAERAEAELRAYLVTQPGSARAHDLLQQITVPSAQYYPLEHFEVTLSSGQSLSLIAERYLGTAMQFYGLAKYNGIKNPSSVVIGQKIRIPMTANARSLHHGLSNANTDVKVEVVALENAADAITEQSEALRQDAPDALLNEAADTAQKADPIEEAEEAAEEATEEAAGLEPADVATLATPPMVAATPDSVFSELEASLQRRDFTNAMHSLEVLKAMTTISEAYRDAAIQTLTGYSSTIEIEQPELAAARLAEAADLYLANKDNWPALNSLKRAAGLDGSNAAIAENLAVLQKRMSDRYHRQASSAFRRQELDTAIANWNRVLEIDPQHSSASVHLVQAQELKTRLERLSQSEH